jgi:hypothetical protein
MQPLFSNARSKAAENHIKLSDTRRATLAWLALLIMRARLVAARAEFRQFRDQVLRDRRPDAPNRGEQIFLFAALPANRARRGSRPKQNGRLSPQPCRRPPQRDGAKMSLKRDRGKAAVNSALRATARMLTIQPFAVGRLLEEFHAEIALRQI